MKKIIVLSAIAISSIVLGNTAQAQVSFHVNLNVGAQPAWIVNNDAADYYYIPDAECYYNVRERVYVYRDGNRWMKGPNLPGRYRNFDFRNRRVIGIHGQDRPYLHHTENRMGYARANERFDNQHGRPQGGGRFDDRRNDHRNDHRNGRRS
ncbi:hypothetical protein SAMN05421788_106296 [Filimonas lacunae]|uniref:YXWGXW repeat-containing protein n=1 Tax=Filimonas lacunae TaxID=477680 RepID=A0A173MFG6_9BACT|nr:hypothetical protein [Filimonas lacunae]BAV06229.1 hypothetical protein FLA_2245 [Filimonas lacunae]SIT25366.1 hypothetical protein SAMN05421788_106296 [Filimonas lacunae]